MQENQWEGRMNWSGSDHSPHVHWVGRNKMVSFRCRALTGQAARQTHWNRKCFKIKKPIQPSFCVIDRCVHRSGLLLFVHCLPCFLSVGLTIPSPKAKKGGNLRGMGLRWSTNYQGFCRITQCFCLSVSQFKTCTHNSYHFKMKLTRQYPHSFNSFEPAIPDPGIETQQAVLLGTINCPCLRPKKIKGDHRTMYLPGGRDLILGKHI